jgi:ankyrin repeat protein
LDDVNPKDNNGWTPLHSASYHGYLELCEFIIGKIADLNPYINDGKTPIYFANERNQRAIVSVPRLAQIKI